MDVTALMAFLVPNAQQWITDQRNIHRAQSSALAKETIETLYRHFRETTLGRAQIRIVSQIENPPFYEDLGKMGVNAPIDFRQMAGITFDDTVLVNKSYASIPPPISLIFHELVHVAQYSLLGVNEFARRYVRGWAENGFSYASIPLEHEAYQLQMRFEGSPHSNFSVEEVIEQRLGISH
jgi:hypothetical protein